MGKNIYQSGKLSKKEKYLEYITKLKTDYKTVCAVYNFVNKNIHMLM